MSPSDLYSQYRVELNGPRLVTAARVGTLVVIGLNSAFILLDWRVYPERFGAFLAVRLVWDIVMLGVYWGLQHAKPLNVMLGGLYATGLGMLTVIGLAGGTTSNYWPGMMILFLGIPVMLPLSVSQAFTVVATLSAGFIALPLFTGGAGSWHQFLVPVFFVTGAAIECVASTMALERLRVSDFQQRRELEEARDHLKELDQVKARFTANIHHELRTPLTLTLAPLEGLLGGEFGDVPPLQRSYLKTMHVNALRLLKLINNLLDLAKIEGKQLKISRRSISLSDLVGDIILGARPLAERKQITLSTRGLEDCPHVNADQEAIEKILVNLIGNSLKFTQPGGHVVLEIDSRSDGVLLSVEDTGVGIEPGQLEKIFDRFAQADSSATRKHEGTGIGLSLARELVELHDGRIWAESDGPGHGTNVRVWLPTGAEDEDAEEMVLDRKPDASASFDALNGEIDTESGDALRLADLERNVDRWEKERRDESRGGPQKTHRPRVLVCEDNPDMRHLLAHILNPEFEVRLEVNGRDGLAAAKREVPDLVLTDIMMPEMSGTELCEALKGDPATEAVPVVLVTSKAEREMKIEGLELGADDYVTKPFHSRELLARVRSLVRLRQLQAEVAERNAILEVTNEELKCALRDLQEAEAQLIKSERLAAVGEIAAGIAHEVNNPVNFAGNAARALKTYIADLAAVLDQMASPKKSTAVGPGWDANLDEISKAVVELTQIIEEGLERTGKLVGDLRDFAAPNQVGTSRIDLVQTLESSVQLMSYFLQQRQVSVEIKGRENVPCVVGDGRALGQVFLNTLKNAAEAFEELKEGRIWIDFKTEGENVRIDICDNGPGIPGEIIEKLFEPFVTTKQAGQGTGLGLSISRKIVEEAGGTIAVESEPGEGTRLSICLPAERGRET